MSKTNETIAALDRFAHRIGLKMEERGNTRCFEFGPTRRWLECKPGGAGLIKVTAYSVKGGNKEAEQYRTEDQMIGLMWRAIQPLNDDDPGEESSS